MNNIKEFAQEVLKNVMYERNKHGNTKKLITISNKSVLKLQKASKKYSISTSYILDLLVQNYL